MSVFRNAVQECLDYEPEPVAKPCKLKQSKQSNDIDVEKFSGLRIRNPLVSHAELSNRFSDIRFVQLPAIKNLLKGDTLSGCWATVGVLTEKSNHQTSSSGKNYCIWKLGSLDENITSVFLFGDAYQKNWKEQNGSVFALFNCAVRKDNKGSGHLLSVYNAGQILKIGTSVDYGVCKAKRKDGMACTLAVNKRRGMFCQYHKSKSSDKYSVKRAELKGGNLRTAFRGPYKPEGVYLVDPLADKTNFSKTRQSLKLLSMDGLKKALSKSGKVTTNLHSQGIRFLTEMTGNKDCKVANKGPVMSNQKKPILDKRLSSTTTSETTRNQQPDAKRKKTEHGQASAVKTKPAMEKMIELDFVSSDEEF